MVKLVQISCPACGGKLEWKDVQSGLATCQYCGNQFLVDDGEARQHTAHNKYTWEASGTHSNASGSKERPMWVIWGMLFAVFLTITGAVLGNSNSFRTSKTSGTTVPYTESTHYNDYGDVPEEEETNAEKSPLYNAMISEMFQKDSVTPEELQSVKYLQVVSSIDEDYVWYSFDDPYSDSAEIRKAVFPGMGWDVSDAESFTGLVCLKLGTALPDDMDLSGMTELRGLSVRGMEIDDIVSMLPDAGKIIELRLADIQSMEGISCFVNLEKLYIQNMPDENLKQLIVLKNLKELSLEDTVSSDSGSSENELRVRDYSAISVMPGLESLYLESDIIRDVGFLEGLSGLSSLTLKESSVISLEPLGELTGLRSLCLIDNNDVKDFDAVGRLTGLRELTIKKAVTQTDPDLSALTELEKLDVSGLGSVASLRDLKKIKELSIRNCNVDGIDALSTLSGVERLTFYSVWNSASYYIKGLEFLEGMTNLKYADFNGDIHNTQWFGFDYRLQVAGDVSCVFNLPNLEELYLDEGSFEIDFERIAENPSLRVLSMRDMSLHENYYLESYSGVTDVWYDDVELCGHLDFLKKFPNLEELYLDSNELTDLEFARELKHLSRLSVRDNYITDLSPLVQAEHLDYLNIEENAVGELEGMDEDVEIVR